MVCMCVHIYIYIYIYIHTYTTTTNNNNNNDNSNCSAALFANALILSGLPAVAAGSRGFMRINKRKLSTGKTTESTQKKAHGQISLFSVHREKQWFVEGIVGEFVGKSPYTL